MRKILGFMLLLVVAVVFGSTVMYLGSKGSSDGLVAEVVTYSEGPEEDVFVSSVCLCIQKSILLSANNDYRGRFFFDDEFRWQDRVFPSLDKGRSVESLYEVLTPEIDFSDFNVAIDGDFDGQLLEGLASIGGEEIDVNGIQDGFIYLSISPVLEIHGVYYIGFEWEVIGDRDPRYGYSVFKVQKDRDKYSIWLIGIPVIG